MKEKINLELLRDLKYDFDALRNLTIRKHNMLDEKIFGLLNLSDEFCRIAYLNQCDCCILISVAKEEINDGTDLKVFHILLDEKLLKEYDAKSYYENDDDSEKWITINETELD